MLNVLFVTQDDPFYIPIFFKELLKEDYSNKFVLEGIIIQKPLGKKSVRKLALQMLNFFELRNFLIVGMKFINYKILNFIAINVFKGKFPGAFSVEHILRKNELKIIKIGDINSKESLNYLKSLNLNLIFSIAASQIFKKDLLALPQTGCFNIHTSKLPKNRGMMPNFWSLLNHDEDQFSAVTIHKMNEKLDDGDILIQHEFKLDPRESLDSLIKRTKRMSAEAFLRAIELLNNPPVNLIKNDPANATYNSFPGRKDVLRFKQKGLKLR